MTDPATVEAVARAIARAEGGRITGPSRHVASDEGYSPFPERRGTAFEDDNWQRFEAHAHFALAAHEQAIKDAGMVVVPREPTEAMYKDGAAAIFNSGIGIAAFGSVIMRAAIAAYRAMIAASERGKEVT